MTSQIPDLVLYDGQSFSLSAVDGTGLFEPDDVGLAVQSPHTACWRGFIVTYAIGPDRPLTMVELSIGSDGPPVPFEDVPAVADPDSGFTWIYRDLVRPIAFTGRLLIGDGELDERPYLNMGFWPAWMYPEVYELTVEQGHLVQAVDCSEEVALLRERIVQADTPSAIRPADRESIEDWVHQTFSLSYEYSWPGRPNLH